MKKLILVLAAALALTLLCSCAKPLPEEPVQADPEPEAPAAVHVTTFTADILSSDSDTLSVRPADEDPAFGAAEAVTVTLADGLVPTGADGWPISVSELTQALQVDITYLGDVSESDPPQVLAVAIRVVPSEEPAEDIVTPADPQPVAPVPEEPEAEPFAPVELPAQDPVPAEIPYDGITLYGFQSIRTEIVRSGEADLDGCGTPESVQLLRIWDQYDQQSFVLRIQKGSDVFDTGFEEADASYPASFNAHIWLADLDTDGYPEVYFNGNMNGDQYVLNVWSLKTGTPQLIPFEDQTFMEAAIIGVSDNSLQLESTQNVLGSYSAIRAYALHDDVLTPLGDAWQIVPANTSYSRMTVVMDIPVTLDDGTQSVFGPGTVLQVTGTGTVQKDGAGRNIGNDHGLAALDDAPRDALAQRIMAPPLLGGIQAVGHLDADLTGMGRHKGDHAPHHVQVLRHQRERRLQAVADVAGMVDDLGKVEQQPQLADRFTYALPMRRQHRRCGGNRPFLIRGGRIRRWRLLVSFHAQDSPFRLPADIPARLQLLEIGHLSFPGIRHRKRHTKQDTQGACAPCHGRGHTGAMRKRCPYRE